MIIKSIKWLLACCVLLLLLFAVMSVVMSIPNDTIEDTQNIYGIHNLHLIDHDSSTGFKIFRLGEPDQQDIKNLCLLGVTEIAVLSGTAGDVESNYKKACPELKVVYNVKQKASVPLDRHFIEGFDQWIADAKSTGKTIAFRCNSGSHRTGRLAAYYQIRYRGINAKDAWDLAQSRGVAMHIVDKVSGLQQQFIALEEFVTDKPCSQGRYCVSTENRQLAHMCDNPLTGCGWLFAAKAVNSRR